jgi:hypothetical protein
MAHAVDRPQDRNRNGRNLRDRQGCEPDRFSLVRFDHKILTAAPPRTEQKITAIGVRVALGEQALGRPERIVQCEQSRETVLRGSDYERVDPGDDVVTNCARFPGGRAPTSDSGFDGHGDFGVSPGVRRRSERVTDHPFVATDVGLQGPVVVAGDLLLIHPTMFRNEL